MHNIDVAIAAALGAIVFFTTLTFLFADAKRSRTGFIIIGCIIAAVLFLMIGVEQKVRTDHISRDGLFTDRP